MSDSALLCEGIIRWPYWEVYWGPNWRTTSANSTSAFGGQTLRSTMAGPPSLEEAVGGLAQQFAELVPQRLGQVGRQSPAGKEPPSAAVGLPDLAEHLEDRFGQRKNTLLVSHADEAQH